MDDVDGIIIRTLNGVGCEWDDVASLSELSVEQSVEGVVRCLLQIRPDLKISPNLPPAMSAKYRITTLIADTIKELGYSHELGYHTFLYSSFADLRKVLMFLIDKLPKETSRTIEEPLKRSLLLRRQIESSIQNELLKPWTPHYCASSLPNKRFRTCNWTKILEKDESISVSKPVSGQEMICTFLEMNEGMANRKDVGKADILEFSATESQRKELVSKLLESVKESVEGSEKGSSSPSRRSKPQIKPRSKPVPKPRTGKVAVNGEEEQPSNEDVQVKSLEQKKLEMKQLRENEIQRMKSELQTATDLSQSLRSELEHTEAEIETLETDLKKDKQTNLETEESLKVLQLTCDLLSSHEENLKKLESLVSNSKQRHRKLEEQWQTYREPLDQEIAELGEKLSTHKSGERQIINEIKLLRLDMEETRSDARLKEQFHQQLDAQVKKITKSVSRNVYTKRILEIVENIRKQHNELEKVLEDTRMLQKSINKLQGQLDRSFTLADETVFRDAKKDEGSKKAYKQLAALHEGCDQLILAIQDKGAIVREIQQLQDQVDTETQKNVAANLKRLEEDLDKMKQENLKLIKKTEQSKIQKAGNS